MERRIDLTKQNHDPQAALKQIAGLIQKLSYRDMKFLSDHIGRCLSVEDRERVAEALLLIADNLPGVHPKMPAPAPGDYRR
jgi:hypothetical protein